METPPSHNKGKIYKVYLQFYFYISKLRLLDLEVMGVSRSGRVRKKSSKLMDFQSPDDIETKLKKNSALKAHNAPKHLHQSHPSGISSIDTSNIKSETELDIDTPSDVGDLSDDSEDVSDSSVDSNDQNDVEMEDNWTGSPHKSTKSMHIDSAPKRSLYMTEKSRKRAVLDKDGKVMMVKAHRKDKGKSRFTAYMLWAKDVRQEMLNSHPDLDFSTVSKKLGEMWANVPSGEKYNWKKRAKRLAARGKTLQSQGLKRDNAPKFINKEMLNRNNPSKVVEVEEEPKHHTITKRYATQAVQNSTASTSQSASSLNNMKSVNANSVLKPCVQQPADIAAYLKLLGDNLTIIGERLKEHEGQITVSGSLSVLLDSILCSIGPLMCLTSQIPNLGVQSDETKEHLANILDNIAYVMPGL